MHFSNPRRIVKRRRGIESCSAALWVNQYNFRWGIFCRI